MQNRDNRQKGEKNPSIELLRVIATVLVVIGHSGFYAISTSVEGMGIDWFGQISDGTVFAQTVKIITALIYSCHMHLFFFISGFVLAICLDAGKYRSIDSFIKNKARRLLYPYLGVTLLFNIPILAISGYFGDSDGMAGNIGLYIIGYGKNHLWFLIALWIIFVILYRFARKVVVEGQKKILIAGLAVSLALYFIEMQIVVPGIEFLYIDRVLQYAFWFVIGIVLYIYREKVDKLFLSKPAVSFAAAAFLWMGAFYVRERGGRTYLTVAGSFASALFGILLFYILSVIIANKYEKILQCKLFSLIDKESLSIYLYGPPVNYVIIDVMLLVQPQWVLGEAGSALLFMARFLMQFIVPVAVGRMVKAVKKSFTGKRGNI